MKIIEYVEKKELISKFAKELAELQMEADKFYYIDNNKDMADYVLIYATEIKDFATKLGICEDVYKEAYKIYDFRSSGKKDYKPTKEQLDRLKNFIRTATDNF